MIDFDKLAWRKATASGETNCIELAAVPPEMLETANDDDNNQDNQKDGEKTEGHTEDSFPRLDLP